MPLVVSVPQYATNSDGYAAPKPITKAATAKNLTGPAIPNEVVIPSAREINPLTEKLIEISMANKLGNVLPNCAPHVRLDMLTCNVVSMLTKDQVVNGTNSLRSLSMLDFVAVEVGMRRAKRGKVTFIQWGYCPKMKGHKKDPWSPWISLVKIFGGKSCVRVYLTDPSAEVSKEANAVQKAVEAMVADSAEAVTTDGKYAKEEQKQEKDIRKMEKQLERAEARANNLPSGPPPNNGNHARNSPPRGNGPPPNESGPGGNVPPPNGPGPEGNGSPPGPEEAEHGINSDAEGDFQTRQRPTGRPAPPNDSASG
jgi:hypothetical protein